MLSFSNFGASSKRSLKSRRTGEQTGAAVGGDLLECGWRWVLQDEAGEVGMTERRLGCNGGAEAFAVEDDRLCIEFAGAGEIGDGSVGVFIDALLCGVKRHALAESAIVNGEERDAEGMQRFELRQRAGDRSAACRGGRRGCRWRSVRRDRWGSTRR